MLASSIIRPARASARSLSLATLLLASVSALAVAPASAAVPHAAEATEAADAFQVASLNEAFKVAATYGRLSVLSSVIENVRLAPQLASQIEFAARRVLPSDPGAIAKARAIGQQLAREGKAEGFQLPPGADPAVPALSLSETDANYGWLMSGADAAERLGLTGAGVTVGVIDSGIARRPDGTTHPEFEGRIDPRSISFLHWIDPTVNEADFDDDPDAALQRMFDQIGVNGSEDVDGHGTHVAGIIGAARDGRGMVGIAPLANLLSVAAIPTRGQIGDLPLAALQFCGQRFLLSDGEICDLKTPDAISDSIAYLTRQADVRVTNGSFGPNPEPDGVTSSVERLGAQFDALSNYIGSGKIWVAASGNGFLDAPIASESPDGLSLAPFITPANRDVLNSAGAPVFDDGGIDMDYSYLHPDRLAALEADTGAAYGRIVTVVAVGATKDIASYSNRCGVAAMWCIAAPGGELEDENGNVVERPILSAVPQDVADRFAPPGVTLQPYRFLPGTSMAAPHVAGALAVLIEAYPGFTPGQIVDIMFRTAEDLGAPGIDAIYGHGLLRLDQALDGPIGMAGGISEIYEARVGDGHLWRFGFSSQGALLKTGGGLLQTAQGSTIVFGQEAAIVDGIFQVDGTFGAQRIFAGENATIGGSGLIEGDLGVAGELAPGSSPGTLTVVGAVGLLETATTTIEVDGPGTGTGAGNHDRVIALGEFDAFTAAGTLAPRLRGISAPATNSFTPQIGETFEFVLTPNGRVAGSFATLEQPTAGLADGTRFDVIYAPQALALVATPADYANLSLAGISTDAAADAVGGAIQSVRPDAGQRPDAQSAALFDPLYRLSAAQLPGVLSVAAGTIHVDVAQESLLSIGRFSSALSRRHLGSGVAPEIMGTVWATSHLGNVTVGDGASSGYDANYRGFAFGIEGAPEILSGHGAMLGFAGGFSGSSLRETSASADLQTLQAGVYGSVDWSDVVLSGAAGLAYGHGDTFRSSIVGGAAGEFRGIGGFVDLAAALPVAFEGGVAEPYAAFGYRAWSRQSGAESGALALGFDGRTFDETFVAVGGKLSTSFMVGEVSLEPTADVAYRFDVGAIDSIGANSVLGASFAAPGAQIGRHAFVGSLGVSAALSDKVTVSASYETELRSNLKSHGAQFNLIARW
jgi:subtilase-type serine protease